jgi:hypothetical protein
MSGNCLWNPVARPDMSDWDLVTEKGEAWPDMSGLGARHVR